MRRNGDGWEHTGDAMDVALLAMAYKAGQSPDAFRQDIEIVQMVPYESENKFSGVYYKQKGELCFAMKGALEIVAKRLSDDDRRRAQEESEKLAVDGYRVLSFATGKVTDTNQDQLPCCNGQDWQD